MARTGRPREFDRDDAVEQAMLLFWERGYEATTLNDLRSALGGLSPASFYAAFGSKEALFGECLSLYMQSCGQLATLLADTTDGPREAMRRTLHAAVTAQTSRTRPRSRVRTSMTGTFSSTLTPRWRAPRANDIVRSTGLTRPSPGT